MRSAVCPQVTPNSLGSSARERCEAVSHTVFICSEEVGDLWKSWSEWGLFLKHGKIFQSLHPLFKELK